MDNVSVTRQGAGTMFVLTGLIVERGGVFVGLVIVRIPGTVSVLFVCSLVCLSVLLFNCL